MGLFTFVLLIGDDLYALLGLREATATLAVELVFNILSAVAILTVCLDVALRATRQGSRAYLTSVAFAVDLLVVLSYIPGGVWLLSRSSVYAHGAALHGVGRLGQAITRATRLARLLLLAQFPTLLARRRGLQARRRGRSAVVREVTLRHTADVNAELVRRAAVHIMAIVLVVYVATSGFQVATGVREQHALEAGLATAAAGVASLDAAGASIDQMVVLLDVFRTSMGSDEVLYVSAPWSGVAVAGGESLSGDGSSDMPVVATADRLTIGSPEARDRYSSIFLVTVAVPVAVPQVEGAEATVDVVALSGVRLQAALNLVSLVLVVVILVVGVFLVARDATDLISSSVKNIVAVLRALLSSDRGRRRLRSLDDDEILTRARRGTVSLESFDASAIWEGSMGGGGGGGGDAESSRRMQAHVRAQREKFERLYLVAKQSETKLRQLLRQAARKVYRAPSSKYREAVIASALRASLPEAWPHDMTDSRLDVRGHVVFEPPPSDTGGGDDGTEEAAAAAAAAAAEVPIHERPVSACTILYMINRLTNGTFSDTNFRHTFLLQYRSYERAFGDGCLCGCQGGAGGGMGWWELR